MAKDIFQEHADTIDTGQVIALEALLAAISNNEVISMIQTRGYITSRLDELKATIKENRK